MIGGPLAYQATATGELALVRGLELGAHRKLCPPFTSARREDSPPTLGLHAMAEAMLALAWNSSRLIGPLWHFSTLS